MSLLDWFKPRHASNHQLSGQYSFLFGPTTAGGRRVVTERSAMQLTAVYSCVRILAEAVAGLPLHVYRTDKSGSRVKAIDHPLYGLLHDEPNLETTSFVFRETLMTHLLLWGNAFAQVIRNGLGEVVALYPLMPDLMSVGRDLDTRELYYEYQTTWMNQPVSIRRCGSPWRTRCMYPACASMGSLGTRRSRWQKTFTPLLSEEVK